MPPRFSSITLVSSDIWSCRAIQVSRSFSRAIEARTPTTGTKLSAASARIGSLRNSTTAPPPISTVSRIERSTPVSTHRRTPSMSRMPRVIRSPVCTRSCQDRLSSWSLR